MWLLLFKAKQVGNKDIKYKLQVNNTFVIKHDILSIIMYNVHITQCLKAHGFSLDIKIHVNDIYMTMSQIFLSVIYGFTMNWKTQSKCEEKN